jgi:hypothetical protein
MSCARSLLIASLLFALSVATAAHGQEAGKALPMPRAPGKSLPVIAGSDRVTRSFAVGGVDTVVLRAEAAQQAEVATVPGRRAITVSGVPAGDAKGYHPADPNWRETPASQWGFDFQAKAFGPTLVISSSAEIRYIHHYYHLESIRNAVPPGVKVVKENRTLTGEGTADLSRPIAR